MNAATFGWLCVETFIDVIILKSYAAATFGWLCVETFLTSDRKIAVLSSHLRVAVC